MRAFIFIFTFCMFSPSQAEIPKHYFHLSKAVQYQTIKQNTTAFVDFYKWAERTYPLVFKLPVLSFGRSRLIVWKGRNSAQKPILLAAHIDVVPPVKGVWKHPPFSGFLDKHFIWGRGTLDDKHAVIAILEAAERLIHEGYQPSQTIYFAFGGDEESGGHDGAKKIARYLKAQKIHLAMVNDEGSQVVERLFPQVSKPIALIGVAEKGYLDLELVFHGKSGHASRPTRNSAIDKLGQAIVTIRSNTVPYHLIHALKMTLKKLSSEVTYPSRLLFLYPDIFQHWLLSKLSQDDDIRSAIQTTVAITMVSSGVNSNVIPETAKLMLNVRILPGDSSRSVIDRICKLLKIDRKNIVIKSVVSEPVSESSISTKWYRRISQAIHAIEPKTPVIVAPTIVTALTDSRHYQELTDTIYRFIYVRGTMKAFSGIHGLNEHISYENFDNLIRFYTLLMKT